MELSNSIDVNEDDDDLNFSYVEQCHNQIIKLREEILSEKPEEKFNKYSTIHRLFKYNVFEYIEPKKRQYLDKILIRILISLGEHINKNLLNVRNENSTATLKTPTPVVFSSRSSSRSSSRLLSPFYSGPRTRSMSGDSRNNSEVGVENEVIIISSDEDEPEPMNGISIVTIKQEKPFENDDFAVGRSVNLQDISDRLNNISSMDIRLSNQQTSNNKYDQFKWAKNTLLMVNTSNPSNFIYDKYGVIHMRPKNEIKYTAAGKDRQAMLLNLVSKVLRLIQTGTYMTKRQLYYLSLDFCRVKRKPLTQPLTQTQSTSGVGTQTGASQTNSQQVVRSQGSRLSSNKLFRALDDLCCLVGCSKVHLHILSQTKGLVYGNLTFKLENGEFYDCLSNKAGVSLPTSNVPIIEMNSNAKFVLILEKDSVMQKLLNNDKISEFIDSYKVILFTAKGYPDVTSRGFIKYLWTALKIPILALTDADPHGIEIACTYKFGVYSTAYESTYTAVPHIRWMGFLPSDIIKLSIHESKTIPQTSTDIRKLESLLIRPYLRNKKNWMFEIKMLRELGRKAELEALDKDGDYLISTYLPNKLRFGSWM